MTRRVSSAIRRGVSRAGLDQVLVPPPYYPGCDLTLKRRLNFYLARFQRARAHSVLWGYPFVLTIEAANSCNLRCPYCFTGAGERSRPRALFPLPLYERILDELGDYLMHIELYNWGEPLLNRHIDELIRPASARGISTLIATNFSLHLDVRRAEALVSSGLSLLGVSLDGARQETYEQYRVGGNFETVVHNIRLINQTKQRLGSRSPRVVWSYHVFPHNRADVELARTMAGELGIELCVTKGWVEGPDWDPAQEYFYPFAPRRGQRATNCHFLWERAVIHVDGGVAPCDGTFFTEDDFGRLDSRRFKQVWNNENFRAARRLFRSRARSTRGRNLICFNCPATLNREDYRNHMACGGDVSSFTPRFTMNDGFNFFFQRRRRRRTLTPPGAPSSKTRPPLHTDSGLTGGGAAAGEDAGVETGIGRERFER